MNERISYPSDPSDREPEQAQYTVIRDTLTSYIEHTNIRGIPYAHDIPDGDDVPTSYKIPVDDSQVEQLFKVPREIRDLVPHSFYVEYITEHRIETAGELFELIRFGYTFDYDKEVLYELLGVIDQQGEKTWDGTFVQGRNRDYSVESIERPLNRQDLNTLTTVVGSVTRLNP